LPVLSVMVFLLHVGRLPLAISRIVSRNRILCEATFGLEPDYSKFCLLMGWNRSVNLFKI